jgi:SSS family transporter
MNSTDYAIFLAYLLGILLLGIAVSRKRQSRLDFMLAGRSMKWFPVGASIMATVFSTTNFTGFAGEVLGHGLYVLMALPVFILVAFPITLVVMPYYHQFRLVSVYELLEKRFDTRVRRLASGLFIAWRIVWIAVALYATSSLLAVVTGMNLYALVFICGLITIAYTAAGGMRAVMWTDVAQCIVLMLSLVIGAVYLMNAQNAHFFRSAAERGLMQPFLPADTRIFSLDPTIRMTMWSVLIGTFTAFLARYGVDQKVVQRYFAAESLTGLIRGFWLNVIFSIVALLCLAVFGLAAGANTVAGAAAKVGPMQILGHFIASLPGGICGLLVAGLFASTMSGMNTGVHSCYTAIMNDFVQRRTPNDDAQQSTLPADRSITLGVGLLATVLACFVGRLGTVFEIANRVINGMGSPLLALFLLGMFSKSVTNRGALYGGILGIAWSIFVSSYVENIALHYYAVVNLLGTMLACYVFSMLPGERREERAVA